MTKKWNPQTDMPSLHGKIAVVTGANSDIGRETARLLALKGAKVYLTVRSEAKGEQTRKLIQESSPQIHPENLEWLKMDLTDVRSITAAADLLKRKERKLDILINNAAAATWSKEPVGPGWENHMAVNLIGPFTFTNRVLPLLRSAAADAHNSADVRVVTLASTAPATMLPRNYAFHFALPSIFRDPVPSRPWAWRCFGRLVFGFDMVRYAVSKAAGLAFAQELQRRLDARGLPVVSLAVHPGEVATAGVLSINNAVVGAIARLTFVSPEEGVVSPAFAATAREVRIDPERYKGKFLLSVGEIAVQEASSWDAEQVGELWKNMTEEVNRQMLAEGLPPLEPL
ncbi:daunorubicin c-13 ketoreductase [Colletotrichum plurivorum]|uniref:Daunorubicin c-13 ketoreductase n=1 Tax=Colletotrichum plurivorum TaxID=2175906 RepID=A0A8H6K296_9PEZI|nr:daunorubicin c-13 ketoreductase [Colletotrichum plurivorum]